MTYKRSQATKVTRRRKVQSLKADHIAIYTVMLHEEDTFTVIVFVLNVGNRRKQ